MALRGIRGATVVREDKPELILTATKELLSAIQKANLSLSVTDIASCIFTMTEDLRSEFPAKAARQMGWEGVPLMCAQEIPVANSLPKCIRVLVHWNTDLLAREINHVYLGEASILRPEFTASQFGK